MKLIKTNLYLNRPLAIRDRVGGRIRRLSPKDSLLFNMQNAQLAVYSQAVSDSYLHIAENKNEIHRANEEIMTLKLQIRNMQATLSEIVKKVYD